MLWLTQLWGNIWWEDTRAPCKRSSKAKGEKYHMMPSGMALTEGVCNGYAKLFMQ